jgi:membrane protein DedA with SNARE-associated domain
MEVSIPAGGAIQHITLTRSLLLALTAVRGVVAVIAIPLAPGLYKDHYLLLLLLRPTKDVLLLGGFLLRDGSVGLAPLLLAAIPLAVLGVWIFYALGRAYSDELRDKSGDGLPTVVHRLLRPDRVRAMGDVLDDNRRLAILAGRLSVFPSSMLAAAAGAGGMEAKRFLPLDALGAALSIAEVLIVGYALGSAYKSGSAPLSIAGAIVFVATLVMMGRWLRARTKSGSRTRQSPNQ